MPRVLLLLPYAWNTSPSQRYRIEQWSARLTAAGVELHPVTLMSEAEQRLLHGTGSTAAKAWMLARCMASRVLQLRRVRTFDAIWLHRTAWPIGPALLERFIAWLGVPIVYEFDDAIFLADTAAANARWAALKFAGKTAEICRMSRHVVVGNDYLAEYARRHNGSVTVVPSTIDTDLYRPRDRYEERTPVVIGWSGSATTVPHLRTLDGALRRVAREVPVVLHVIGTDAFELEGVPTYVAPWSAAREIPELNRFDVGIMPLPDEEWTKGKCALKALLYMSLGIPAVASPVGMNGEVIRDGQNGRLAATEDEWVERLLELATDVRLRERLGRAGRRTVEERYSAAVHAPRVLEILREVCG